MATKINIEKKIKLSIRIRFFGCIIYMMIMAAIMPMKGNIISMTKKGLILLIVSSRLDFCFSGGFPSAMSVIEADGKEEIKKG